MDVLFILLPIVLFLVVCAVISFLWALKNGQMDDLETPAVRILFEEDSEIEDAEMREYTKTKLKKPPK